MRWTDNDIRHRIAGLMRLAGVLLLLVWTVLAVGCSGGGDEPETPGTTPGTTPGQPTTTTDKPIAFSAIQQEEQSITRAVGLETRGISTFYVYGFKNMNYTTSSGYDETQTVFPGFFVNWIANSAATTTSNTNDWEYVNQQPDGSTVEQTIKYWDWSANAYRFFGYTDGTIGGSDDTGPKTLTLENVDATTEAGITAAPYFSTLWFSTGNPTNYPNRQFGQPVQLVFTKPFTKVRMMFISADPENVPMDQIYLDEIMFKPTVAYGSNPPADAVIETAGTVTVSYPLTGTEIRESISVPVVTASLAAFTEKDVWNTVLPASNQGSYTLSVRVNGEAEPRTVVVPAQYMDWLPGFEYTYVFKIYEEGGVSFGQVYTAFTDWLAGKETDYTIYNW